jgi:hypothetical protein
MTTLMRCGRDRRSGKPVKCHARKERALLVGTRSANHIRAGGHSGCTQRPDTWLHPNASRKRQIPLASRAPSIHGTFEPWADVGSTTAIEGNLDIEATSPRKSRWACARAHGASARESRLAPGASWPPLAPWMFSHERAVGASSSAGRRRRLRERTSLSPRFLARPQANADRLVRRRSRARSRSRRRARECGLPGSDPCEKSC